MWGPNVCVIIRSEDICIFNFFLNFKEKNDPQPCFELLVDVWGQQSLDIWFWSLMMLSTTHSATLCALQFNMSAILDDASDNWLMEQGKIVSKKERKDGWGWLFTSTQMVGFDADYDGRLWRLFGVRWPNHFHGASRWSSCIIIRPTSSSAQQTSHRRCAAVAVSSGNYGRHRPVY